MSVGFVYLCKDFYFYFFRVDLKDVSEGHDVLASNWMLMMTTVARNTPPATPPSSAAVFDSNADLIRFVDTSHLCRVFP